MNQKVGKQSGFTVVELLIVIVVIGILAALVLNTFSGAQAKARDAKRKNDLVQIKKSELAYNAVTGNWVAAGSGCGYQGDGYTWFNYTDGTFNWPRPIQDCLKDGGYISQDIIDPSGMKVCFSNLNCTAYMHYHCGSGDAMRIYAYAHLETEPQTTTATDSTCQPTLDTDFGMNYFVQIK